MNQCGPNETPVSIAAGILVEGGLALVARRPPGTHLEGTWEFPGGKVRPGETCEEALRREVREEVGVGFEAARELGRTEHRYPDRTVRLTFFLCTGIRGRPAGREGQEIRWVDAGELEQLPIPAANRAVIPRLEGILIRRDPDPPKSTARSEPRERELKFRVRDREDFLRALRDPRLGELTGVVSMDNHYFDTTGGVLVGSRVMLRLRRAEHFVLGLKLGDEPRAGFFDSVELEERIPPATARGILERPASLYRLDCPPVRALRERFEVLPLVAIGSLRVERTTKDAEGRRLEFDRLVFPDGCERFELEIETDRPEGVESWLRGVLRVVGIEVEPQRLTKLEQLVAWKREAARG